MGILAEVGWGSGLGPTMRDWAKLKILLANRPKMLRELLRELIGGQGDMQVVGEALDPLEILYAVRKTEADVVVTTLPATGEPAITSHLLAEYPDVLVLALAPDGGRAVLYRQVLLKEKLQSTNNSVLLSTLRQASAER